MTKNSKMPAWFNRECGGRVNRDGGGSIPIKARERQELEQMVADEPRSLGNPNAIGTGAAGMLTHKLLQSNKLSKALPMPLRGIAAGLAGAGAAISGKRTVDDAIKVKDATYAASELRKRKKADEDAGGYKRGGKVRRGKK